MIQDKLSVSLEAKLALVRFFGELLSEVYRRFGVTPGELINLKFKKQHITPAREWVVRQLRSRVLQRGIGKKMDLVVSRAESIGQHVLLDDWKPVSYPVLANLLGFHHSALIHMMQRIAKREAREKRQAEVKDDLSSGTAAKQSSQTDVPTGSTAER